MVFDNFHFSRAPVVPYKIEMTTVHEGEEREYSTCMYAGSGQITLTIDTYVQQVFLTLVPQTLLKQPVSDCKSILHFTCIRIMN